MYTISVRRVYASASDQDFVGENTHEMERPTLVEGTNHCSVCSTEALLFKQLQTSPSFSRALFYFSPETSLEIEEENNRVATECIVYTSKFTSCRYHY